MIIPDLLRRLLGRLRPGQARRLYALDHAHDHRGYDGQGRPLIDWAEESARYGMKVDR